MIECSWCFTAEVISYTLLFLSDIHIRIFKFSMVVPMAEGRVENSCQRWRAIISANLPKGTYFDNVAPKLAASDADRQSRGVLGSIRSTIELVMNNIGSRRKRTSSNSGKKLGIEPLVSPESQTSEIWRRTFHHKKSHCRIHHLHHRRLHVIHDPFEKSYFDKIDTNAICAKCYDHKKRACNFSEAQEDVYKSNLCSTECRPPKTFLHLQEVVLCNIILVINFLTKLPII